MVVYDTFRHDLKRFVLVGDMKEDVKKSLIFTRELSRIYRLGDSEVVGIKRVDLDIAKGDLVVLKGNSGSGKSTLLSVIAGLDRATS